jgi:hypothetical protein
MSWLGWLWRKARLQQRTALAHTRDRIAARLKSGHRPRAQPFAGSWPHITLTPAAAPLTRGHGGFMAGTDTATVLPLAGYLR